MVEGNSMNASQPTPICHGDYILFRVHNRPQNNDLVVASKPTESGEFAHMVKRYRDSEKELISETNDNSESYPSLKLNQYHQILGVVIVVAKADE
jgi:SOS-response transcriptional repressor LexA